MNIAAIKNTLTYSLDFFIPRTCNACNNYSRSNQQLICDNCSRELIKVSNDKLPNYYSDAFGTSRIISDFYPLFEFNKDSPIQSLLHELKYNSKFRIGVMLGEMIAEQYYDQLNRHAIDYIIPIPLHRVKKAERGYNQAYYITKGISNKIKIPLAVNKIKRIKFTKSQTTFTREERIANLQNAFALKKPSTVKDRIILLVDDVVTTGSTTNECAKVLREAGAKRIIVASVAVA